MNSEAAQIQTDIVIAGGGPVGLALACCLAETGLNLVLVDAGSPSPGIGDLGAHAAGPPFDPRVSALTVSSQALLDRLGVWSQIAAVRVCPYFDMDVWDGEGTGAIHFSAADIHADCLGHIVENRVITAALSDRASTIGNLVVLHGETVTGLATGGESGRPVAISLESGKVIRAAMVVGADGARSFIRAQGGFGLREWDYGHKAIVTTVTTVEPHRFTAWQRFMHTGPLAFLPLKLPGLENNAQQTCSIVWSCVTEKADALCALDDGAFRQALGEAFEFRLGAILATDPRVCYPLWQRHARDYVQDHIALVGDAAHTIHPLAGQGVNLGFADVEVLARVITQALARGEDYTCQQVLSRYQRRRKGPNMAMMAAMEGFKRLFASDNLAVTWLRNAGLDLTDSLPLVKHQLMRRAMGIS